MTLPPPGNQPPGYRLPRVQAAPPGQSAAQSYRLPQPPAAAPREVTAPTLFQFWRSDSRVVPGRKPARWAGLAAFWLGMIAAVLFFAGMLFETLVLVQLAFPLSTVAFVFALIAIVAGIGRGLGVFGLVFALAANAVFWAWLAAVFG
jgi:hypothetical protein